MQTPLPFPPEILYWLIPVLLVDLVLRGWALWRSARSGQRWWFIALMVVNSMGILPLLYLLLPIPAKKQKSKR